MTLRPDGSHVNNTTSAMILKYLDSSTLHHLAAAVAYDSPKARARRELTPQGIDRLLALYLAGGTPTVGFFVRAKEAAA